MATSTASSDTKHKSVPYMTEVSDPTSGTITTPVIENGCFFLLPRVHHRGMLDIAPCGGCLANTATSPNFHGWASPLIWRRSLRFRWCFKMGFAVYLSGVSYVFEGVFHVG